MKLFAIIALVVALAVPGYATAADKGPNLNKYKGMDVGFLVFSVAHNGQPGFFDIRRLDAPGFAFTTSKVKAGLINLHMGDFWKEFPQSALPKTFEGTKFFLKPFKAAGDVVVMPLPPGEYELYGAQFTRIKGVIIDHNFDVSYRFSIKEGRTSYIGEIDVFIVYGRPLGYDLDVDLMIGNAAELERDVALAAKENPGVKSDKVDLFLPANTSAAQNGAAAAPAAP